MLQWKEENKFPENPTDVLKFTFSPGFYYLMWVV